MAHCKFLDSRKSTTNSDKLRKALKKLRCVPQTSDGVIKTQVWMHGMTEQLATTTEIVQTEELLDRRAVAMTETLFRQSLTPAAPAFDQDVPATWRARGRACHIDSPSQKRR